MGQLFTSTINSCVVDFLKSNADGDGVYNVDEFQTEFPLNKLPGSDNAPKCHMFIKKTTIQCQDLNLESEPLSMKSSKIIIQIGEAVVRCDDLGYTLRISGRITIFDVFITASLNTIIENVIKVSYNGSEVTVKNIKPEIELLINGTDHSRLANVLLSIDNPHVASNLLNAVLMIQKENIIDFLNVYLQYIVEQYV